MFEVNNNDNRSPGQHYLYPANNYLYKVSNRNTTKWCKICSKSIITPFLLLTLNIFHNFFSVSIVDFE